MSTKNAKLFTIALIAVFWGSCDSSRPLEPGGRAADATLAVNDPDEYAWQLFFFLSRPAKPGKAGIADRNRKFGDVVPHGSLVWETWALASGGDDSEVFKPGGVAPVQWADLHRGAERRLVLSVDRERLMVLEWQNLRSQNEHQRRRRNSKTTELFFPLNPKDKEIRINQAAFESVVAMKMYSCEGLASLLQEARTHCDRSFVNVQPSAKEVKAIWIPISLSQRNRYYSREDDEKKLWGLAALHISTKDLPNWFWADFVHIDCEDGGTSPCSKTDPTSPVAGDTKAPPRWDSTTMGANAKHGSNGVRNETRGSVWQFYRLRGTQINFIKPWGEDWKLSDPVIEKNVSDSSCIGCHALAAIGSEANSTRVCSKPLISQLIGDPTLAVPPFRLFGGPSDIKYLQTDFMWAPIAEQAESLTTQ